MDYARKEVMTMKELRVNQDIVSDSEAVYYEWFELPYTSPSSVRSVIETLDPGEELRLHINSYGGDVFAASEIFSLLQGVNSTAYIESIAASAASVIAMGAKKTCISPTAMIMVHDASTYAAGNKHAMQQAADALDSIDHAIAAAYTHKSGMPEADALALMDKESWITADAALEYKLVDEITEPVFGEVVAAAGALSLTPEMRERAIREMAEDKAQKEADEKAKELHAKTHFRMRLM